MRAEAPTEQIASEFLQNSFGRISKSFDGGFDGGCGDGGGNEDGSGGGGSGGDGGGGGGGGEVDDENDTLDRGGSGRMGCDDCSS